LRRGIVKLVFEPFVIQIPLGIGFKSTTQDPSGIGVVLGMHQKRTAEESDARKAKKRKRFHEL
jgi:hypothetical protein